METWLIYTLIGVGALILAMIFEPSREFLLEQLEIAWEGIEYIFTFQWIPDLWDFISGAFEDMGEFSVYGLGFGLFALVFIFYTRSYMIEPFVQYYEPAGRMFWTIATYVTVFVGCYLLGKGFENSS